MARIKTGTRVSDPRDSAEKANVYITESSPLYTYVNIPGIMAFGLETESQESIRITCETHSTL